MPPTEDPSDTVSNWTVGTSGATVTQISLSAITSGTSNLIIGEPSSSGSYTGSNGSLTTVTNEAGTVISFGTAAGEDVTMNFTTPEPASADLVLLGVVLLFFFRRQVSASLLRRPDMRAATQRVQP